MLLLSNSGLWAQLPSPNMPLKSRPDLFTFYEDNNPAMPSGANSASKSLIYLQGGDPNIPGNDGAGSTAFIIRTFRDDDSVCVCMTGHQISDFTGGQSPTVPGEVTLNNYISMNFKGTDLVDLDDGVHYVGANEGASSYLHTLRVVAYYQDPLSAGTGIDAALVLIRKRQLPSANYTALGYDFSAINALNYQNYFTMGHPWCYPQRLVTNLVFDNDANNYVWLRTQLPFASGPGASGSPLINSVTTAAQGILASSRLNSAINPERTVSGRTLEYKYATNIRFTRMSLLESAIKEHCWKNANKEQILSSGSYKQTVQEANPGASFFQEYSLSVSQVANIFSYSRTSTGDANGKKVTDFAAKNCTFGSFTLPAVYPGTTSTPWQVVVTAKQVDVTAGFSYTASGSSELDLNTVAIYGSQSAASKLAGATDTAFASSVAGTDAASCFKLYPNPSTDGTFYLELPHSERAVRYKGTILSIDGKAVRQLNDMQSGQKVDISLPHLPKGFYLLNVQNEKGIRVFSTQLIYE
ncbi:hypothetical protein GCM10023092_27080 [Rurimicrobium arvi]|uniref:Secretion system C-terminal sorting domain-containing protein n=2 Tax=Rurimicrobium arvi TaxID=2049916 RepID=A0ABP8N1U9_9BACT